MVVERFAGKMRGNLERCNKLTADVSHWVMCCDGGIYYQQKKKVGCRAMIGHHDCWFQFTNPKLPSLTNMFQLLWNPNLSAWYSPRFSGEIHIFLQDPRALTLVPSRTLADGCRWWGFSSPGQHQKWQNKRNSAASGSLNMPQWNHLWFSGNHRNV